MSIILRVDGLLGKITGTVYGGQVIAATARAKKRFSRLLKRFQVFQCARLSIIERLALENRLKPVLQSQRSENPNF
jgi:hypothetical protein